MAASATTVSYVVSNPGSVVIENQGAGDDSVQVAFTSAGTYTLTDNVENARVTAAASIAVSLAGNALDNVLIGNAAANTLAGGGGNDTLDGGAGADKLIGGSGDDTYVVSEAGDVVTELLGEGNDIVYTGLSSYTLGANVEALIYTGSTAFTGTGNTLDNLLQVQGVGGARLDGGAGNDTLQGGDGADSLQGGIGDDTFRRSAGNDTIDGGAGTDLLTVAEDFLYYKVVRVSQTEVQLIHINTGMVTTLRNVENFSFLGQSMTLDQLASAGVTIGGDTLYGTSGIDYLNGGPGADVMIGGDGDDVYTVSEAGDKVVETEDGGNDRVEVRFTAAGTYVMAANVEQATVTSASNLAVHVTGNDSDNVITGNGAANRLIGGAGNDTLNGGLGNDGLSGGSGDDTYYVDASDVVTELAGEGNDLVLTALASCTLSANVERLHFTGAGGSFTATSNAVDNEIDAGQAASAVINGGAGNDTLTGSIGNDVLDGGAGIDSLVGGAGDDTYVVDNAGDVVVEAADAGRDLVKVALISAGTYTLADHIENATITSTLAVSLTGNELDNVLTGNAANNTLTGGAGNDTLNGGSGNDVYTVGEAGDVVSELADEGTDTVQTTLASYALTANVENLSYTGTAAFTGTGNALDNILRGGVGADVLSGGDGNDVLFGGAGNDRLTGGAGVDTFVLNTSTGNDTLLDFVSGTDRLKLDLTAMAIGNRDAVLDEATLRDAPGGFTGDVELAVFSATMSTATTTNAAKVIGSASSAFAAGDTALFAVSTASATYLYRFVSSGADAVVSAAELTQLAVLVGTPSVTVEDFIV